MLSLEVEVARMRYVIALLLVGGCGGTGVPAAPAAAPASVFLCAAPSLLRLDAACAGLVTADGRECAICTDFSGCGFDNRELGYCVDRHLGCADPNCR